MEKNLAWQVGSTSPPAVCLCCGMPFNDKLKIKGPYYNGPYIWVCQQCWESPYLFFSDKVINSSDKITRTYENLPELLNIIKTIPPQKVIGMARLKAEAADGQVTKYKISITPDRTIDADLRLIPLAQLKLDKANVRFKHYRKELTEKEMTDILWSDPDFSMEELKNEIVYSQGLTEPPVVDYNHVVKEGNRRVACSRRVATEIRDGKLNIPVEKIDPVECIVLPKDTLAKDVAVYLARVHVSGRKEWRALNQAAHIYDLYNMYKLDYDDIRKAISKSKSEVMNMEKAFKKTLEYHSKFPDDDSWLGRYSYFYELYKRDMTKQWATKNTNMKVFMKWIHDGKVITKGADVRLLPNIIENKEAYQMLLKGHKAEDAYKAATGEEPNNKSSPLKIINKAITTIKKLPRDELRAIAYDEHKVKLLKKFYAELGTLIEDTEAVKKK